MKHAPLSLIGLTLLSASSAHTESLAQIGTSAYRITIDQAEQGITENLAVHTDKGWEPALAASPAIRVVTAAGVAVCSIQSANTSAHTLILKGKCNNGRFEQRLTPASEIDVLEVSTRFKADHDVSLNSLEDRYDFMPARNVRVDTYTGPLDFVWSQNIKSESDDLVAAPEFKSPVVLMQQREVFAGILAGVDNRHVEMRALDLDVTSSSRPWMSYGAISFEPHGHSYFHRSTTAHVPQYAHTVEYHYQLLLSAQPSKQGYRRAVRLLWEKLGHPELLRSSDEQRNVLRPELHSFDSWRDEAWMNYADRIYSSWPCGTTTCGTLASNRNITGDWNHPEKDAWFNPWFQTLRTAYGWYVHGKSTGDAAMMSKAESVLNLALTAPRTQGAFATIYTVPGKQWTASDGWAGYKDSYDAFSMSWTAYWMLRWAQDLVPARKTEILNFAKSFGDFLLREQKSSGVIPSWYQQETLEPQSEFANFNAETAPSALFLVTLSSLTKDARYLQAAEKAMNFITDEVVPRQRWFDFETFLSCARKPYDFFDPWTSQFPQNNLAEMQAPEVMLSLYQATGKQTYLERGQQMLDYLLLTQQVWNNPALAPMTLGGFTTQNTDAEWSDARQGYAAIILMDYYQQTGRPEYLERAIAASRSTFAVAPWENWAHTGYIDEPGALTGFHWGTGSAMTSIELMQPVLGDAMIDLDSSSGAGFDECTLTDVIARGKSVSFSLLASDNQRTYLVKFRGVKPGRLYSISWNHHPAISILGSRLMKDGLLLPFPAESKQTTNLLQEGKSNHA